MEERAEERAERAERDDRTDRSPTDDEADQSEAAETLAICAVCMLVCLDWLGLDLTLSFMDFFSWAAGYPFKGGEPGLAWARETELLMPQRNK